MRAILKDAVVVLIPEDVAERDDALRYLSSHAGHVFELRASAAALTFADLGPRADACREPINIGSRVATLEWRPISNFALAPFVLDGRRYASTEAFWQGLKFDDERARERIAALHGYEAKKSANDVTSPDTIVYDGATIRYAGPEHWALMRRACEAKFGQDLKARRALLSTGTRPLEHRMRRDSRSIPGVIMSRIWMDVRAQLAKERVVTG